MDYFTLSINLIEYMKLFVYQNNQNLIIVLSIRVELFLNEKDVVFYEEQFF